MPCCFGILVEHDDLPRICCGDVVAQDVKGIIAALQLEIAVVLREPAVDNLDHVDGSMIEMETRRYPLAVMVDTAFDFNIHGGEAACVCAPILLRTALHIEPPADLGRLGGLLRNIERSGRLQLTPVHVHKRHINYPAKR